MSLLDPTVRAWELKITTLGLYVLLSIMLRTESVKVNVEQVSLGLAFLHQLLTAKT